MRLLSVLVQSTLISLLATCIGPEGTAPTDESTRPSKAETNDLAAAASGASRTKSAGVVWDDRIPVAQGGGYRGPWQGNRSRYEFVDDPAVDLHDENFVGVAWVDQSRKEIFFQLYEPDGAERFERPVKVSRSPRVFSWLPRLVIASSGATDVYVLWQEIIFSGGSHGGEILFARSNDGGKTFGEPINLSNSRAGDGKGRITARYWDNGSLDLVRGRDGALYAAWTEYDGNLWFSHSKDGGKSFSEPSHVAGDPDHAPARGPSLAIGDDGTLFIAWTVGEDRAANIHLSKTTDGGRTFAKPRALVSTGHSDAPKIAVDRRGTIHLVYAESPDGPFERYQIRYRQLKDGEHPLRDSVVLSGAGNAEAVSAGFPALSLDGEDNLYVIWELFSRSGGFSRGLGFAFSSDQGQSFTTASRIPGSIDPNLGVNGSQQGLLMRKLAVNSGGSIAVVNSTFKRNQTSRIWLFRGHRAER